MQKEIERNFIRLANTAERKVILHLDVEEDLMLSAVSVIKWGMKQLFAETRINQMVKLQGLLIKRRRSTCFLLHVSLALNQVKIGLLTNKDLLKELRNSCTLKIHVGDGKYITVNEKGTIAISTNRGTKLIFDMLYVPEIDKNLLSVADELV